MHVPAGEVWGTLAHRLNSGWVAATWPGAHETITIDVRAPRVLLGAVVGAGLAAAGTTMQALVRNPLADPYLLGVSSGASLGAVAVIVSGVTPFGAFSVSVATFGGALVALLVVYGMARTGGRITTVRLVLAGVAVAYVLSALTSLVLFTAPRADQAREVLSWTLGGLGGTRWKTLGCPPGRCSRGHRAVGPGIVGLLLSSLINGAGVDNLTGEAGMGSIHRLSDPADRCVHRAGRRCDRHS